MPINLSMLFFRIIPNLMSMALMYAMDQLASKVLPYCKYAINHDYKFSKIFTKELLIVGLTFRVKLEFYCSIKELANVLASLKPEIFKSQLYKVPLFQIVLASYYSQYIGLTHKLLLTRITKLIGCLDPL